MYDPTDQIPSGRMHLWPKVAVIATLLLGRDFVPLVSSVPCPSLLLGTCFSLAEIYPRAGFSLSHENHVLAPLRPHVHVSQSSTAVPPLLLIPELITSARTPITENRSSFQSEVQRCVTVNELSTKTLAMKLDVNVLRYLTKDEFRVLTATEMGMKNHELVPAELVERIAGLRHGGAYKNMKTLLKHKLVHHDSTKYDGYRLTNLGYDYLAIKTMVNRGLITGVGRQIGVGKESDIFEVVGEDGRIMALKLHRLGRTSFRAVKSKRDYLKHRSSFNWLYLSRLAALKEYAFMKALGENGFPVPEAVDWNRHCVLMSLVPGYPLVQVKELQNPALAFETVLDLIVRLAQHGLIHCDFNEFNLMVDDEEKITMIDFPQMVSVSHRNAQMYFDRDVECIYKFFGKRYNYAPTAVVGKADVETVEDEDEDSGGRPVFDSVKGHEGALDTALAASGFTKQNQEEMDQYVQNTKEDTSPKEDEEDDEDTDSEAVTSLIDDASQEEKVTDSEAVTSQTDDPSQEEKGTDSEAVTSQTPEEASQQEKESSEEDDDESVSENPGLQKGLDKQRRKVVKAVRSKNRQSGTRNASKDKGGRRSRNITSKGGMDF